MTPDTHAAQISPGLREQSPAWPIGMKQSVSWAGLALPVVACTAIWGIGDAAPVGVAWLSILHTAIGTAAATWTALRFVLRRRVRDASRMVVGRLPPAGLLLLYTLLVLQPVLAVASSMLHGRDTTLLGVLLPSVLPMDQTVALEIDKLHGWNALLVLGLITRQLLSAFSAPYSTHHYRRYSGPNS